MQYPTPRGKRSDRTGGHRSQAPDTLPVSAGFDTRGGDVTRKTILRRRLRQTTERLDAPRWPWEALTKDEHDALAALRDRPVTQDPIQLRHGGARPDDTQ